MLKIFNSADLVLITKKIKYLEILDNILIVCHVFKFGLFNRKSEIVSDGKHSYLTIDSKTIYIQNECTVKFIPEYENTICCYDGKTYKLFGGITVNFGKKKVYIPPEEKEIEIEYISCINKENLTCNIDICVGSKVVTYKFKIIPTTPHASPHTDTPHKITPEVLSEIKEVITKAGSTVTSFISKEIVGEIESLINGFGW
jgi:hypothetical protein